MYQVSPAEYEFEVKKSRFIAYARPFQSADEFKSWQSEVKTQHPDARHWVSCCLLGSINNPNWLLLDDNGEPSNTAAKPILNVLTHNDIGDCGIIVVRYFGGIKLGAGGLARAYGGSASGVIANTQLSAVIPKVTRTLSASFQEEAVIRRILDSLSQSKTNCLFYQTDYVASGVTFTIDIEESTIAPLSQDLSNLLHRDWELEKA